MTVTLGQAANLNLPALPSFGNNRSLVEAAQNLSAKAQEGLNAFPYDPHPTARNAWNRCWVVSRIVAVCLFVFGSTWGSVSLLLEWKFYPILIGVGGGILLWTTISFITRVIERILGPEPDYRPYNAYIAMQNVNYQNESEFYSVPVYCDSLTRSLNDLRKVSSPPLKSHFEERVDTLMNIGVNADKKYHGKLARFLVQARCQIALNYVRDLMCGPELTILDSKERIARVQKRAKEALEASRNCNVPLSAEEQKVLLLWSQNEDFLKGVNFKTLEQNISRHEFMPFTFPQIDFDNVKTVEAAAAVVSRHKQARENLIEQQAAKEQERKGRSAKNKTPFLKHPSFQPLCVENKPRYCSKDHVKPPHSSCSQGLFVIANDLLLAGSPGRMLEDFLYIRLSL